MPHEVTGYLTFDKNTGWAPSKEVIAMVALDEGFDRAFWQRVDGEGKAWLAKSPDKILESGIFALMREVEITDSSHLSHPEHGDTLVPEEGNILSVIASIDEGYSISLHVHRTSTLNHFLEAFLELPVEKHLLIEVSPGDLDRSKLPVQKHF
jgi:hypothetical protein